MAVTSIICLGVATLDQIFRVEAIPSAPAKFRANEFIVTGAANAALAVQRLGGNAHYWGRVGDDDVGDQIIRLLERESVNVSTTADDNWHGALTLALGEQQTCCKHSTSLQL